MRRSLILLAALVAVGSCAVRIAAVPAAASLVECTDGACPLIDGVCCAGGAFCCPAGHQCDDDRRSCTAPDGAALDWTAVQAPFVDLLKVTSNAVHARTVDDVTPTCPDGAQSCDHDKTCCKRGDGYGCCPSPNAVCCADGKNCCPAGYVCDSVHQRCARAPMLSTSGSAGLH